MGVGGGDDMGEDGETELENDVERGEAAEKDDESGECAENDVFDEVVEIGESHTRIIGDDVSLLLSMLLFWMCALCAANARWLGYRSNDNIVLRCP